MGKSGQNDPGNLEDYCLKIRSSDYLFLMSKQCLRLFHTFQCGIPLVIRDVTRFYLRTMAKSHRVKLDILNTRSPSPRSSRKPTFDTMKKHMNGVHEVVRDLANSMTEDAEERKERDKVDAQLKKKQTLKELIHIQRS